MEAKNKAGEKLEKNQLIKLQSGLKTQLEKELLEFAETRQKLLLAASVDVRERVGVCGKCCSFSHETKECPRRNIVTTTRAKSAPQKHHPVSGGVFCLRCTALADTQNTNTTKAFLVLTSRSAVP